MIFCLISSAVIKSLGEKPVRGGSPASERRVSIEAAVRGGVLIRRWRVGIFLWCAYELVKERVLLL